MTRFLAAAAAMAAVVLLPGTAAVAADPVNDAVNRLRTDHVYVSPDAEAVVDADAVRSTVGGKEIRVAVLPASVGNAYQVAIQIGRTLGDTTTVAVVAGRTFNAASNALCQGAASAAARAATSAHQAQLSRDVDVTATLKDFVGRVESAPRANTSACGARGGTTDVQAAQEQDGSALPWVFGIGTVGVLGAAGGTAYALSRRRRRLRELEGRRAEVLSLYDRLGADVQHLDPKEDPVARQAIVDAAERYTATGSLLSHADTEGEYAAARRTALEGLQAARTARSALGLDPGPELPPIAPAQGEQLTQQREVSVAGKTYQGYPEYTPGAPYYYGGGAGVPGGWYSFPFWETVLIGSVLGGGLGGWGGGGYGAGYDQGYGAGHDAGEHDQQGWGGGDWGGGGDFGGGDWGGGGGDWGGGGDSGGGSW